MDTRTVVDLSHRQDIRYASFENYLQSINGQRFVSSLCTDVWEIIYFLIHIDKSFLAAN